MNKSQFKLVCMDFDQTIINSGAGFEASFDIMAKKFQSILEEQGIQVDINIITDKIKAKDKEFNKNKSYNRDLWWNPILKQLKIKTELKQDEVKELTKIYWNTVMENTIPYPDTFEILDYLKGKYTLGLISDTDGTFGMKKKRIQYSKIAHYFNHILVPGDDISVIKPDPEPFLIIAKRANVNPSKKECIMIGDKPFTDIKGAKNAGFTTVLILRADWEIDPVPDYSIKELRELKDIL